MQLDSPLASLSKAGLDKPVDGEALEAPLARLDFLRRRPALQARVTLGVKHLDVQLFIATLRPLCGSDRNAANVLPTGIANGLVRQGSGRMLYSLVERIGRADAACEKVRDRVETKRILESEAKRALEERR